MFTNSFKLQAACRDSRGWSQHSCRRISECWCHGDREWAPGARLSGAGVQILWWCTRWIHEVSCGHRETKQRARAITGHRSTCTSVAAGNCIWGVTPRSCIWLDELSLFHFHFFLVTSDIRHLSWAYFLCNSAKILICWCQTLLEQWLWTFMVLDHICSRSNLSSPMKLIGVTPHITGTFSKDFFSQGAVI